MSDDKSGTAPGSDSEQSGHQGAPAAQLSRGLSLGRYVVLERLGAGGMGVVYAAYDPELDRKVAIKLLRTDRELGAGADRSTRLLHEAKALAGLSHPNVVTVHDVGTFLGQVFIAMEFIGGGTLTAWLSSGPPWREVLRCFTRAGAGLAAAHTQHLVHRDFKPDNVLLDAKREPKVTDFGLARKGHLQAVAAVELKAGKVAGTVGFLSPEQARRQVVDARSDQFSFCLSLYLGLYGELAFPKEIDLLAPLPPVRPAPRDSTVPGWVRRVVLKGLSEDPAARFASMGELLTALEADPARARRELVTRAAALALIATVAVLGVLFLQRETPQERSERECLERVDQQLASMWSPARRTEIEQRFSGLSEKSGPDTWNRVRELLGPELEDWSQTSRASCRLRGDPDLRAHRTSCLEEHRTAMQSMSDLFARADAYVMAYAVNTVLLEVTPASACTSSAPVEAARWEGSSSDEAMRLGLARARVLYAAGKRKDAIGTARDVANEARTHQAPHVEAEAMLLVGEVSGKLNRPDAEQNLHKAIEAAERVGNDEIRARAWIELVFWYAQTNRPQDARLANNHARAIIRRLGDPPLLRASQLMAAGRLAEAIEGPRAGRPDFEEALALRQRHLKTGHPSLENARSNFGSSLPEDQALPLLSAVLETQTLVFGANHPDTADAHRNLGIVLEEQKDCLAALSHFQAALDIRIVNESTDRLVLGQEYGYVGSTLECLGRFVEAETYHRKAVTLLKEGNARPGEQRKHLQWLIDVLKRLDRPGSELAPLENQLLRFEP